ncbi:MAG: DUF362 domain-containing protein, partial [Phycisphaerae bacterium]|nr:DUF362 domain-containing protein [Gammaproteobacteria bacterium]NIQ76010.1 DUF362 domain-containing protein [Gammaproteobacteria bacterium]NIS54889.1 DUF362 domain-containing protein [Phycisphaerae bacterium]NIU60333.1 DUF362 domain-containing protein [Phycisphaerae bacterium]NIW96614.1 DUF362 domain-containing protein [Phycisphaerae bacterium]
MPFSNNKDASPDCPKKDKLPGRFGKYPWLIWLFPVVGLISLIWFLIRVVPKPSRATYPCQRAAFPLASGFIIWLFGLGVSTAAFRKARTSFSRSRYLIGILCLVVSIGCVCVSLTLTAEKEAVAADPHPVNEPVGIAGGIHPGRVVWVHDPNATEWEGPGTGEYWWQDEHTDQNVVDSMMQQAVCAVAGETDLCEAWDRIFRHFNQQQGRGDVGYRRGEDIMIKVNFVDMIALSNNRYSLIDDHTPDYAICSPHIIHSLLDQLVNVVGVEESDITVGDPICMWCHEFYDMIQPDFPNVRYLDYHGNYNRTKIQTSDVPFYWSTSKADGRTQDYVLQSYVDAEYFINLASLKGHYNQAGITVCAKNHYGSLRGPAVGGYYNMHLDSPFNIPASGSYRNMVDLMGHRDVGGKTVLCLIDGLYTGKHVAPDRLPQKWQMEPFNNDWCSSIFASQDQVAIDSVAFDFLVTEWPEAGGPAHAGTDDYLHEAALAANPPSQTFYDPERDGTRLASLGVHEHWNNPIDKKYSRNLGTGNGIQLWQGPPVSDVDFSGDGKVDFKDVSILAQQFAQNESSVDVAPEPFGDGVVDGKDLGIVIENWLTATVIPPLPQKAGSPEPFDGATDVNTILTL